jgi:outer membrane protein assembly factor BamA
VAPNPDYLQINTKTVFEKEPGKVDLIYEISEGKQFRLDRILVKGNTRTKDNVILREMHMRPGQEYDSSEVEDAADRLRGTPYFTSVSITPVGDDPTGRDLQVEVEEGHTAQISAGVGVNSNGGFGGQLSYEQKNFDLGNWPASWGELFSDRAFTGAGQDFLISFEPGTQGTDAEVSFTEPYLFDQPYSLNSEAYLRDRIREQYDDFRPGGRVTLGERFNYVYSADVFVRAEDVDIRDIQDPPSRPAEILNGAGHHTLTSAGVDFVRDTTNHGPITYKGTYAQIGFEEAGALSGQVNYTRVTASFNDYQMITEDLLGRKTVLNSRIDFGNDLRKAPFYERFYGGGIGSVRGFEFRGISPRAGIENDQIGGDFAVTGGEELGFPLAEDILRGVVFFDVGDVESNMKLGTIRTSVGFGIRLVLPFFGSQPLALDLGFPLTKNPQDQTQIFSFSFGVSR